MYLWDQDKARFLAEMLHRKHQEWQRGEHLQEFLVNRGVAWKVGLPAEDTPRLPSASDAIDDLFWFLVKKDPVSAIADLVRPSDLADWANSVIGENGFYSEASDRTEMAKTILAEYGIPLPPPSTLPYSLDAFQQRLGQIRDQLLQYENDGDVPDGTLRGLVLDGWSEFETLLRLTLVFWKHALGQEFEHEWLGVAIDSALAQRSLNALVEHGFRSLGQFSQSGVPERVSNQRIEGQEKQHRELRKRYDAEEHARKKEKLLSWRQDREAAKRTLIDGEEYKKRDDESRRRLLDEFIVDWNIRKDESEQEIREAIRTTLDAELRRVDQEWLRKRDEDAEIGTRLMEIYQNACQRRLKQALPFDLERLRHTIDEIGFRNRYAHEDSVFIQTRGVGHAIDALDALRRVGDQLARENMCPSLVVIVGIGRDVLGRELVLFTAERDVTGEPELRPTRIRWVLRSHADLRPYQPCYIVSKRHFGDVDPFMVDAETVLSALNQHRAA